VQSHGITLSFHCRPEGWGGWAPQRRAALLADGHIAYALGDVSGGDLDVVTSIWTTGWTWKAVATGDFNHDGTKDIVWRHWRDGRMADGAHWWGRRHARHARSPGMECGR
jgi:hypothetical protein